MKENTNGYIEPQAIFDATNAGFDIICYYYPDAAPCEHKHNHKFKVREEKTPSASCKYLDDKGLWIVTDFGDDGKGRNGIDVCMLEEGIDFGEALKLLASRYGVAGVKAEAYKAGFEKRTAKAKEKDGEYDFKTIPLKKIPNEWLKVLFARFDEKKIDTYLKVLSNYHVTAVESFTYVKDRKALITKSTEHYPIFIIEGEGFKKIYQPQHEEKQYRFRYVGNRPKDYIFGLDHAKGLYNRINADFNASVASKDEEERKSEQISEEKLKEVILCSGDRDALNVAAMGYPVVWMNSESAVLTSKQYKQLMMLCDVLYNLPDIDDTGVKQGKKLALQYLDIHTINLPEELKLRKDWRGNACKDLRDYLRYYTEHHFRNLLKVAYPLRFWDVGYTKDTVKYELNNVYLYNFLSVNGFYRMKFTQFVDEDSDYIFIHKQDDKVVKKVGWKEVKKYVNQFLEERRQPIRLRNMFYRSNQLAENSLDNISETEIDFSSSGPHHQVLFFNNKTWEVSDKGIKEFKPDKGDYYVWAEKRIVHDVELMKPSFEVRWDDKTERYTIDIHDRSCLFLQFLINSSRIHWRKEQEAGVKLTEEEKYEEELHLINKIYAIGYMLHRHKKSSEAWCVFAMDNKISDQGESHGGSGKSIIFNVALRTMLKHHYLEGRNPKVLDDPHHMEGVSEHTDFVIADDCNQYFKFDLWFSSITAGVKVNPKGKRNYEIPFSHAPKFVMTSNFTPREISPSVERRLLYAVSSDYYHFNTNDEYHESRSPRDEFGKELFDDFDNNEWNCFYNTMALCLHTRLKFDKINPPMDNVNKRNLRTLMTDAFLNWADAYFHSDTHLNCKVGKKEAMEAFKQDTNMHKWTSHRFKKSLSAWCKYHGYVLNPKDVANNNGRIIETGSVEMLYIRTPNQGGMPDKNEEEKFDLF